MREPTIPYLDGPDLSKRRVLPVHFWFGATEWHPKPQRMMTAFDLDKGEMRDFAVDDIEFPALAALKEKTDAQA